MLLNEIRSRVRRKKKKRVGRGSSSGHGKTSTRGHKGAKSRAGRIAYIGFAGGQTRLFRKLPKIGFNIYKKNIYQIVNLSQIAKAIKKDINEISPQILKEANLIRSPERPVKILAEGELKRSFTFKGCTLSKNANKKIQACGGKIIK